MSDEFGPPNCAKCGYAHQPSLDCQQAASSLAAPPGSEAELAKLEQERLVVACREIWLRQRLEETQKELKSLCDKCDAFKMPPNEKVSDER